MPKKLPLGLQDFRKIIENGFLYVDKTQYLYKMASNPGAYFFSRPRRFGKSITIATLHELFSGSRELFEGLWIQDKWDWSRKNPVLRLTFTGIGFVEQGLEAAMHYLLDKNIRENGLPPIDLSISSKFEYLIQQLARNGKVVVLIDEYDAPIIHYLGVDTERAIQHREMLREFYTVLKNNDPFLEFVFLTGVSKFSKTGIFSGLNNLTDLTMHPEYATMVGYTQAELESNFSEEIEATALKMQLSREDLLEKLRLWYNGYRFHHASEKVYNPVSVNMFFDRKEFENFWFATGTPTFLIDLLKKEGVFELNPAGQTVLDFDTFDLEDIRPYGLLYQTGYLTIQSRDEYGQYTLDYPNREVKDAMVAYLLEAFGGVSKGAGISAAIRMEKAFVTNDLDAVMRTLQSIFADIPYFLYEKYPEKFFHAAIHLLFTYMGIRIRSEVCTADGRADSLVETPTHVYILEYKLDQSPAAALEQIKQKKYYRSAWASGKPVVGVGVNFSSETKNIEGWVAEEI
ncbi:MAG: AAA family ATPase [Saprospiraceae bacterium]|nr:AAA family ATPase [Saprospiraceae bacterium]